MFKNNMTTAELSQLRKGLQNFKKQFNTNVPRGAEPNEQERELKSQSSRIAMVITMVEEILLDRIDEMQG